jgi:hypothetical protein
MNLRVRPFGVRGPLFVANGAAVVMVRIRFGACGSVEEGRSAMDHDARDRIARVFGVSGTRRTALAALLSAGLIGAIGLS